MPGSKASSNSDASLNSRELDATGSADERCAGPDNGLLKYLTITFRNLSIIANKSGTDYGDTFLSEIDPRRFFPWFRRNKYAKKCILHKVTGQVRPGEMIRVLYTTFQSSTNPQYSYWSSAAPVLVARRFFAYLPTIENLSLPSKMLLNSEDDIHFPTLTVTQPMCFVLRNKAPDNRPAFLQSKDDYAEQAGNEILE
ncbi:hypothetical protein GTA08_BOTSDO13430 [Botryosphaeria dothidea]|uniref:Uncharacterized protein n=1 Tax=Botryosphaeria dothidea TaxID=55169 RepID=A0A8H4J0W6_9PEZI|nr:hypothetical protein GTA08_BOTSDO13430 [Botryosphaeria dothidea]